MNLDYRALGFKSGLEVHHQLDTEKKLFCRCPVKLTNRAFDVEVLRHMRPTLSELGEYDGTALMEFKTKKEVIYRIFGDLNCTYEMDDTPPFLINQQALDYAIEIALMFGMSLVDELHVSRKQYLDGSIPTGFQRTAIIGVNGTFPMHGRIIRLFHLGLEEDSCREVSDVGHRITFKADRLGIPLVEVVTAPDFQTPQEVGQGAEMIRRALWRTGKVRRGPGSVRQDVNVSIEGGTRIEIKGVPRISLIPKLVENEAYRQYNLLKIRDELRLRGISEETIGNRHVDVTRMLRGVTNKLLDNVDRIEAIRLKGFGGLLSRTTQQGVVFADEFSGRVRVIACIDTVPNLLYHDSAGSEGIRDGIWRRIRNRLDATHHDAVLLVFGKPEDVETAVSEVIIRAREATRGVPSETRQARDNGTNDFERILPGPDRMYPDTDHPPLAIHAPRVNEIKKALPEAPWNLEDRFRQAGLPEDAVKELALSDYLDIYQRVSLTFPACAKLAGELFGQRIKSYIRKGLPVNALTDEHFMDFFKCYESGLFFREAMTPILIYWMSFPKLKCRQILKKLDIQPVMDADIDDIVQKALNIQPVKPFPGTEARKRFVMGTAMKRLRGKLAGVDLSGKIDMNTSGAEQLS